MLSSDYTKTQSTILEHQLKIKDYDALLDPKFLNEMIKYMGTVSSVFEKLPDDIFVRSLAAKRVFDYLFRILLLKMRTNKNKK
jgi:hypothetical protein